MEPDVTGPEAGFRPATAAEPLLRVIDEDACPAIARS